MSEQRSQTSVLYLTGEPVGQASGTTIPDLCEQVARGEIPEERVYGLKALYEEGAVAVSTNQSDGRHWTSAVARWFRRTGRWNLPDWPTVRALWSHDVAVVKGRFSVVLSWLARVSGTRLIYLDVTTQWPTRRIERLTWTGAARNASAVVCFSETQASIWRQWIGSSVVKSLPFGMDVEFYVSRAEEAASSTEPGDYVLSVGRDPGRDFPLLWEAAATVEMDLKLVTLPYLLGEIPTEDRRVTVYSRVPYARLFSLYAGATVVCVPLKPGLNYPSGIRALLEAMLTGMPTVVTDNEILREYARDREHVRYVASGDEAELGRTLDWARKQRCEARLMGKRAREHARDQFSLDAFTRPFTDLVVGTRGEPIGSTMGTDP